MIETWLHKVARMAARGVLLVPDDDQDDLQAAISKLTRSLSRRETPWE